MKSFNAKKKISKKIKNESIKSITVAKKEDSYARVGSAKVDYSKVK
jgi:hypothetical protein